MTFSPEQCQKAKEAQNKAARDSSPQVRLVAGPGSGKSWAIEERVCWLLKNGVNPSSIFVVSFTRAAARDLKGRIERSCKEDGQSLAKKVSVSTLHSLALRILREANLLEAYPAPPVVLDDWELERIFDEEFGTLHNLKKTRREEIREFFEAFWSTDSYGHPYYVKPDEPITEEERQRFAEFNRDRTQIYSCVLAGEIVRKCVEHMNVDALEPGPLIGIQHLIVDEYQDLNPVDLRFVNLLAAKGVTLFVAGDDDQSIYSFRYASPAGIQNFHTEYPSAGLHALDACFRCTPAVLTSAGTLIRANGGVGRIAKHHFSLFESSEPPVQGVVQRWKFTNGELEARAIAESCRDLISSGIQPKDILILLSNQKALGKPIIDAFKALDVPYSPPKTETFLDSNEGRLVYSLARIASNPDDYIAHRTILGVQVGVGAGTCNEICRAILVNGLNFKDLFYKPLPEGVFTRRLSKPLCEVWEICGCIADWKGDDTLGQRRESLRAIVARVFGEEGENKWRNFSAAFPDGITLSRLRDFLATDSDEQRAGLLSTVLEELGQPVPEQSPLLNRVRIMTMHGAKGLSGHVVFIPGLEEDIIPGPRRKPYAALVTESARMLYVSITRARAACILSYAKSRFMNGKTRDLAPSRFVPQLNGGFIARNSGFDPDETSRVVDFCGHAGG